MPDLYPTPSNVSGWQASMSSSAATSQANMAASIRRGGSVYDVAFNMADGQQFAALSAPYFDGLKSTKVYAAGTNFANDLEYLQAAVRSSGLSKGTSNVGDLALEDYNAIQKVFQTSYLRGTDWATTLQRDMASPYASGAGGGFSKNVSTALSLLDYSDAESRLGDAYYKAYGFYPSKDNIDKFRIKFNEEANKQMSKTTTTSTGTGTGTSATKTVAANQGFTQEEQDQFLADFLSTNYKITGEEKSGYAKNIINTIKDTYANNLLPEEDMGSIIKFAADLVGTADEKTATQKIEAKINSIRGVAAKLNPGVADLLANGNDVSVILDPVVKAVNNSLGTTLTKEDPRFKQILNFNDGKVTRAMTTNEIDNFISQQPEYQTSATAINKYSSWGQRVKDALN